MTSFSHSARNPCAGPLYGGAVVPIDPSSLRQLLEAVIAGFSVLGGSMACLSGSNAARSLAAGKSAGFLAQRINEGMARGFTASWPVSIVAAIIMALT
jgi:hypothetical protein